MPKRNNLILSFILVFTLLSGLIFAFSKILIQYQVSMQVLLVANAILLAAYLLVFMIQKKALYHSNPNVFIRSIMSGMMIKMFVTIVAVFLYVILAGDGYDKKAVFISLFFYLIYLAVEVYALSKLNQRNAKN